MEEEGGKYRNKMSLWSALLCICSGTYLISTAYETWVNGTWPTFVSPKLDLITAPLALIGKPAAASLIKASMIFIVGLVIILLPLYSYLSSRTNSKK